MHLAGIAHSLYERRDGPGRHLLACQVSKCRHGSAAREIPSDQLAEIDLEQFARQLVVVLCNIVRIVLAAAVAKP